MEPLSKPERDAQLRIVWRKKQMKLKGVGMADFDRAASLVSLVVNEKTPNPRLRKQIAESLGLPYEKVWAV